MFGVNLKKPSTLRGLVWITVFVIGTAMILMDIKGTEKLMTLAAGVVGGLGLLDEKKHDPK